VLLALQLDNLLGPSAIDLVRGDVSLSDYLVSGTLVTDSPVSAVAIVDGMVWAVSMTDEL
jgi:hypothetical protein